MRIVIPTWICITSSTTRQLNNREFPLVILKNHCGYDEETVEDKMNEVSGASDAYNNALSYLL